MAKPVESKPEKYPVPWIATYFVTALALIAGSYFIVWYIERYPSTFDYSDPDMVFLEDIVRSDKPGRGNFAKLNGGDWSLLCLAGAGSDVVAALRRANAGEKTVRQIDAAYMMLAPELEKSEFLLFYVDGNGEAKAVHHPHGFAFARKGNAACTTKTEPIVALPVSPR